ncbi:MAG: glycosyltransferase family 2 protein [Pseudomonadales bacterium]
MAPQTERRTMPIGVVIPAHNEEKFIGRCLDSLLEQAEKDEFQVVVVANGCTDRTAEIAKSYGDPVRVLMLAEGSKTNALNAGEAELDLDSFPRIYLDGDLALSTDAARQICRTVTDPCTLAASPRFEFDLSGSSWPVRAFFNIWQKLPYLTNGRIAGAYALSKRGRTRFDRFPKIISDDGYVRLHFRSDERKTLSSCAVVVTAPKTIADLVKIKTRSRLGTLQLREQFPHLIENENTSETASLQQMLRYPGLVLDCIVYLAVNVVARYRAVVQWRKGAVGWERDESSRI